MSAQPAAQPPRRVRPLDVLWLAALIAASGAGLLFPFSRGPAMPELRRGVGPDVRPPGWEERRKEHAVASKSDARAVVFAGDSITEWWGSLAEDFPGLKTANRGIAGDTSRGLLARFRDDVLALSPRAVVLLIGTNDLALDATPAQVAANVRDLLDLCRESDPAMPVVLCLLLPRRAHAGLFPDRLLDVNTRLRAIADVRRNVFLCDTWTPLAGETGHPRPAEFTDGLHPNAAGYAVLARAVRASLETAGVIAAAEER